MFALLGDVPFEVIGSPEALSESYSYDYAEQRVVQARPRLQWLADDLLNIRLEMLLHRAFTNPAASLLVIKQAASAHAALPLVFGNGEFRGYFVITGIETIARQLSSTGDPFAIAVRLNLRESPLELDLAATPIPTFVPIAVSALGTAGNSTSTAGASLGVSALAFLAAPTGPGSPLLLPDDFPLASIVRSEQ